MASRRGARRAREHHAPAAAAPLARAEPCQERLAVVLRDNWLSNRVFSGYEDIVAHCCAAWNELMEQPWRIRSIGRRKWAHEF
jgi:hypothetical protein